MKWRAHQAGIHYFSGPNALWYGYLALNDEKDMEDKFTNGALLIPCTIDEYEEIRRHEKLIILEPYGNSHD